MRFFTTLVTVMAMALVALASTDVQDQNTPRTVSRRTFMFSATTPSTVKADTTRGDATNPNASITPRTNTTRPTTNSDYDSLEVDGKNGSYPIPSGTSTTPMPSPPSVTPRNTTGSNNSGAANTDEDLYPTPRLTPGAPSQALPGDSNNDEDSVAVDDHDDSYATSTEPRRLRWWFY